MDSKSTQLGSSDVEIVTKKTVKKEKTQKDTKQAISITLGDQSENHVGMAKQGSGLAERGYTKEDLEKFAMHFEETHYTELHNLNVGGDTCGAYVLIIRGMVKGGGMMEELTRFEWDKTYFCRRRQKVLNKHARYNVCFGEEAVEPNIEHKQGTIVAYKSTPILDQWKTKVETIFDERLECEANLYYDVKKNWHRVAW